MPSCSWQNVSKSEILRWGSWSAGWSGSIGPYKHYNAFFAWYFNIMCASISKWFERFPKNQSWGHEACFSCGVREIRVSGLHLRCWGVIVWTHARELRVYGLLRRRILHTCSRTTRFQCVQNTFFAYVFENYAFLACRQCIFWIRVREIRLFLMPDYQGASEPAWTKFRLFGRGDF